MGGHCLGHMARGKTIIAGFNSRSYVCIDHSAHVCSVDFTLPVKHFSSEELRQGCPAGAEPQEKPLLLSDDDFQSVFKMSKAELAKLPLWEQQRALHLL